VLRASMGNGTSQKSDHKAIYLIGQIIDSKTHQKSSTYVGKMK
jgi:hypothetical protein